MSYRGFYVIWLAGPLLVVLFILLIIVGASCFC
ncbi:YjcZ family sporulation protein [Bacillus thuringiensis]|nr:YjcZ family sporulation protein [Bacillus thuringiensis]